MGACKSPASETGLTARRNGQTTSVPRDTITCNDDIAMVDVGRLGELLRSLLAAGCRLQAQLRVECDLVRLKRITAFKILALATEPMHPFD